MSYRDSFYQSREWLELRFDALKKYGRICALCRSTEKRLHVDHIKPRSLHPELELDLNNLQVLCKECNLGKSNRDDTDFREQCLVNARFAPVDAFFLLIHNIDYLSLEDDIESIGVVPADSSLWGSYEVDGKQRSLYAGCHQIKLKVPSTSDQYRMIHDVILNDEDVCLSSITLDDGSVMMVLMSPELLSEELLLFETDLRKDPVRLIEFFLYIIQYKAFDNHVERVIFYGKQIIEQLRKENS